MKNRLFSFGISPKLRAVVGGFLSLVIFAGLFALNFNLLPPAWDSYLSGDLAALAAPTVLEVSPPEAAAGATVRVAGRNLHGDTIKNAVFFGDTQARITNVVASSDGTTGLDVVVPSGAGGETSVRVRTQSGEAVFGGTFTIISAAAAGQDGGTRGAIPRIARLDPTTISVGDALYIFGDGFDPAASRNEVFFGAVRAPQVSGVFIADEAALKVIVPPGATSGRVSVKAGGHTAESVERVEVTGAAAGLDDAPAAQATPTSRAPRVESERSFTLPQKIGAATSMLHLHTFVSDPDGVDDIVVVNANLASIGGGPSNRMIPGEMEGRGRFFSLESITLANPLDPLGSPYVIPVSATDRDGNVGRGEIVFCVGECPRDDLPAATQPDAAAAVDAPAGLPTDASATATPIATRGDTPHSLAIQREPGYLTLSWGAPTSGQALEYFVYYGRSPEALMHRLPAVSGQTAFVTDLTAGERYYFAVTAVDGLGMESEISAIAAAVFPDASTPAATVAAESAALFDVVPAISFDGLRDTQAMTRTTAGAVPTDLRGSAPAELSRVGPRETLALAFFATMAFLLFFAARRFALARTR